MPEDEDIFKPIPFFEWCKNMDDIKPISLIEKISSIISDMDKTDIWEHVEPIPGTPLEALTGVNAREYFLTLIGRFASNDNVTTFEMSQIHSICANMINVLRLAHILQSDWLEDFDEEHRGIIAASCSLMMRVEDKKVETCINNNGPEDLLPTVVYQWLNDETNETGVEMFSLSAEDDEEGDSVYERLSMSLQFLKMTIGSPYMISIIGDSYVRETNLNDPDMLQKAATIKDDFHSFAETDVREAITIITAERTTEPQVVCCVHSKYGYNDYGLPVFDEDDGRSIQVLKRDEIALDPSHRGKMGTILCDFFLENKGL